MLRNNRIIRLGLWVAVCAALVVLVVSGVRAWVPSPDRAREADRELPPLTGLTAQPGHRDLGVLAPGDQQTLVFMIRNGSDHPVRVKHVQPSCGCSPASIESDIIPPGAQIPLMVAYTASALGEASYAVTVSTDAGDLRVTFTVRVVSPIECDPPRLNFGTVAAGSTVKRTVKLSSTDGSTFDIVRIDSTSPRITCRRHDESSNRPSYLLDLSVGSSSDSGLNAGEVTILTNHPRLTVVRLPVEWYISSPKNLSPDSLFVTGAPGAEVSVRLVYCNTAKGSPQGDEASTISPRISSGDLTIARYSVSGNQAGGYSIDVTFTLPRQSGYRSAVLNLSSSRLGMDETVPVGVFVE
jgi:hypothetical protein